MTKYIFLWLGRHIHTVSLVLNGLGLMLFYAGLVSLFFAPAQISVLLLAPAGGLMSGAALDRVLGERWRRRASRWQKMLPDQIVQMGEDEETHERILAVTLTGGDQRVVRLPIEYDPRSDRGELMLRAAAPELFEKGGPLFDEKT